MGFPPQAPLRCFEADSSRSRSRATSSPWPSCPLAQSHGVHPGACCTLRHLWVVRVYALQGDTTHTFMHAHGGHRIHVCAHPSQCPHALNPLAAGTLRSLGVLLYATPRTSTSERVSSAMNVRVRVLVCLRTCFAAGLPRPTCGCPQACLREPTSPAWLWMGCLRIRAQPLCPWESLTGLVRCPPRPPSPPWAGVCHWQSEFA